MKSRRTLTSFGILALCLMAAPGLYAQRGRSGGAGGGIGGGGLRGNSSTGGIGRPADAGNRSGDAPGKPDKPEAKGQEKKGASSTSDNKIAEQISKNPQTVKNVQGLLPTGMTLEAASAGFKNRGQFIAALHVSKNLNIPFADLKTKMTGDNSESLGKSIHALKPGLTPEEVKSETKKAEKQAKDTEKTT